VRHQGGRSSGKDQHAASGTIVDVLLNTGFRVLEGYLDSKVDALLVTHFLQLRLAFMLWKKRHPWFRT
jgi:hypothetical protein